MLLLDSMLGLDTRAERLLIAYISWLYMSSLHFPTADCGHLNFAAFFGVLLAIRHFLSSLRVTQGRGAAPRTFVLLYVLYASVRGQIAKSTPINAAELDAETLFGGNLEPNEGSQPI